MTYHHERQDFGMREEIEFPLDWEIFSRSPLDRKTFHREPKACQPTTCLKSAASRAQR